MAFHMSQIIHQSHFVGSLSKDFPHTSSFFSGLPRLKLKNMAHFEQSHSDAMNLCPLPQTKNLCYGWRGQIWHLIDWLQYLDRFQ